MVLEDTDPTGHHRLCQTLKPCRFLATWFVAAGTVVYGTSVELPSLGRISTLRWTYSLLVKIPGGRKISEGVHFWEQLVSTSTPFYSKHVFPATL